MIPYMIPSMIPNKILIWYLRKFMLYNEIFALFLISIRVKLNKYFKRNVKNILWVYAATPHKKYFNIALAHSVNKLDLYLYSRASWTCT